MLNDELYIYGDAVCLDCGLFWAESQLKDDPTEIECLRCGSKHCNFAPVDATFEELFGPFND